VTIYDFSAKAIDGIETPLSDFRGEVLLIVNVASRCGFTPQYRGLQDLHDRFADRGFAVLGVPCDQFGGQEPGDEEEIAGFCERTFGVTFPMFAKVDVNGEEAHPLYRWLKKQKGGLLGGRIAWNFTKYLVARDGTVIRRYAPTTTPEKIAADVERALSA
jgi:glutathione peroxidase